MSLINNISFFNGITDSDAKYLESRANRHTYKANAIVLNKDDTSDSMYLLESGQVQAYIDGEDGREIIVNTIHEGEIFGELAMLGGEPRSANIICTTASTVHIIQKADLYHCLQNSPDFCMNVLQLLSKKVVSLTEDVSSLALLDVYGRIARIINKDVTEQDGKQITSRMTHQDIANMVGSSREMVSRILKDLRLGGYISIENKCIVVEKPLPTGW